MKGRIWVPFTLLLAAAPSLAAAAQATPQIPAARQPASSSATSPAASPPAYRSTTSAVPAPGSQTGAANPAGTSTTALPSSNDSEAGSSPGPTPHITIATPAPAPPPWPWQDRIRWAAEILLFLLAYFGIWIANSTLRKIERQTHYAEVAAQAAADSAKAILEFAQSQVRAERPWILLTAEPAPGTSESYSVIATNRGRGLARIVSLAEGIAIAKDEGSLPPDPEYRDTDPAAPPASMILLPGESIAIKSFRRDDVRSVCFSPDQLRRVENWEEKIFLFGKVAYVDLQSPDEKQPFETAWSCWYIHGRQKSGMVMIRNPRYVQHT